MAVCGFWNTLALNFSEQASSFFSCDCNTDTVAVMSESAGVNGPFIVWGGVGVREETVSEVAGQKPREDGQILPRVPLTSLLPGHFSVLFLRALTHAHSISMCSSETKYF